MIIDWIDRCTHVHIYCVCIYISYMHTEIHGCHHPLQLEGCSSKWQNWRTPSWAWRLTWPTTHPQMFSHWAVRPFGPCWPCRLLGAVWAPRIAICVMFCMKKMWFIYTWFPWKNTWWFSIVMLVYQEGNHPMQGSSSILVGWPQHVTWTCYKSVGTCRALLTSTFAVFCGWALRRIGKIMFQIWRCISKWFAIYI